ncbi:MAG: T9SS type A sorting domain-containing protein [Bacteroidetes bacterium]|nr:T9SS type A sorting domain-containing protein [Bacteroidota bacterium]
MKLLQTKLSTFIIMTMLFSASANAQIVYTDINPDTSIIRTRLNQRGIYSIEQSRDFNNDGIADLRFTLITSIITGGFPPQNTGYTAGTIRATPLNGSTILTGSSGYPAKLNLNAIISANANWSTLANQLMFEKRLTNGNTTNTGNWNTATDGFLGLRVIAGGQTLYCWIQLNAAAFTSGANAAILTIKDYAFNSVPSRPILAGETSCTTPTVNLTQSGSLSFCAGDSVTLTANGTGYQYQWKKNNVNIAGATAKTYAAKTAGVYKCKVTNSCGSKGSGTRTVTVPCRTSDDNVVQIEEQLSVYPNPATDQLNLEFPFTEGDAIITVVNSLGQTMLKQNVASADEDIQVNVQNLPEGLYFITVQNGERAFYSRFIKKVSVFN